MIKSAKGGRSYPNVRREEKKGKQKNKSTKIQA